MARVTALPPSLLHARYQQQARWTADLRQYLYRQIGLARERRALEVGCGSGAILGELVAQLPLVAGLDYDRAALTLAQVNAAGAPLSIGDAHDLPFATASFDLSLCHFLLLWVADPGRVLREMRRVTRPGGWVLALAEPDYGGRVDFPEELATLGRWQMESLQRQGADPQMGRKLAALFRRAGLEAVETGALGGQWCGALDWQAWDSEWAMLTSDLRDHPEAANSLAGLKALDRSAWEKGERVLFVPTFYAAGRVPA
jgi:ubiquinone/menaquinone biosynthesis C-methylase UbiE